MAKCVLCEKEIGDLEESSLHQCNMLRYNESISPPDVVEAEREKLREMVMKLANEVDCTNIASLHRRKPLVDQAKALVGGEVKK